MFYSFPEFQRQITTLKFYFPVKVTSRNENKGKIKLNFKQN